MHDEVKEYFALEAPKEKNILSPENNGAVQILEASAFRKTQQFEVGLLWKDQVPQLPESYSVACHKLECLKKKFKKDPNLQKTVQTEINKLISKGYARKVLDSEMFYYPGRTWYLPIFVTLNPI